MQQVKQFYADNVPVAIIADKMKLRKKAVEMAWRTEGLPQYLERIGEGNQASIINYARSCALWDSTMAGIGDIPSEKPSIKRLAEAFKNMIIISKFHNYDSGKWESNYGYCGSGRERITREEVVNMAWKAEGLDGFIRRIGPRKEIWHLDKAYELALIPPVVGKSSVDEQREIEWSYHIMGSLIKKYKYIKINYSHLKQ